MNGDEIRQVLKKICKLAIKKTIHNLGYDIDLEHRLYLLAANNEWHLEIMLDERCKDVYITNNYENSIIFGANFMRIVPAIDRFDYFHPKQLLKSPVAKASLKEHGYNVLHRSLRIVPKNVRLPLIDEFAYKFSDQALEIVLQKLMSYGMSVKIPNSSYDFAVNRIDKLTKDFHEYVKDVKSRDVSYQEKTQFKTAYNIYMVELNKMRALTKPISIQVIPSCKNVEELMIILDMSLVE